MSWLDSSFTFAKSALNQAQKSIDKVLDIKEEDEGGHSDPLPLHFNSTSTPSAQTTPHSVETTPTHHTSTSWNQAKQQSGTKRSTTSEETLKSSTSGISGTASDTSKSSNGFNSTWGAADSFWESPIASTLPEKGGEKQWHSSQNTPSAKESTKRGVQTSKSAESAIKTSSGGIKTASSSESVRLDPPANTSTPVATETKETRHLVADDTPSRHAGRKGGEENCSFIADNTTTTTTTANNVEPDDSTSSRDPPFMDTTDGVGMKYKGGEEGDLPSSICTEVKGTTSYPTSSPPVSVEAGGGGKLEQQPSLPSKNSGGGGGNGDGDGDGGGGGNGGGSDDGGNKDDGGGGVKITGVKSSFQNIERKVNIGIEASTDTNAPDTDANTPGTNAATDINISPNSNTSTDTNTPDPVETRTVLSPKGEVPSEQVAMETSPLDEPVEEESGRLNENGGTEVCGVEMLSSEATLNDVEQVRKELVRAKHVLEVREQKIVSMSHEIIGLMEANRALQGELGSTKEAGRHSVEEMREEFTKRIGMSEKKLQAVIKERDSLRKQLMAVQNEQTLQRKTEGDELSKVLKEKDEQVAQLMEEGEKLSKQELQSNGIIKKLRLKERQNDQLQTAQRQQIDDLENKVQGMKDQLKKKEETEKKYQESLAQLNMIAEQQAKELTNLKVERDGLLEKVRSLQTNLDNSYKELASLQKTNAVTQNAAEEAVASANKSKQEEVKVLLEQQKMSFQKEKEMLIQQIEELRMSVSRTEQQLAWKEDHMKQEVSDVHKRLQEAEDRNQELTSTISQATKPLLRQIENLQSAHLNQSANWEKVETGLTQRLVDAQAQLSAALEKERSATEKMMLLKSRVTSLETQLGSTRQEKSQLLATIELERAKLETLEEGQHRDSAKIEALRASFQQSMDVLRKEKEMLERQLEYEKVRLEAESRKACLESQEKERLRSQLANSLSMNHPISHQSSSGSQSNTIDKPLERSESVGSSSSEFPLHGAYSNSSSASAMEHLQSLLRQKEGELSNTQNLSRSLERSRAAMAEDLSKLTAQNESLNQQVMRIPHLLQQLEEVRRKHEAMLQMYGEKAEEAEELKLDIQDLKSMYRQQINELVSGQR